MSARTKRRKSPGAAVQAQAAPTPVMPGYEPLPMPKWHWRTFPVYFAFSVGGFLGLYMGLIAGATGNGTVQLVFFVTWALLLGFGFSRITSRWMMSRSWGQRRFAQQRKAKR